MNTLSGTHRTRWAAVVAVALAFGLAACGGGADTTSTTEAEAPRVTTTTTMAASVASDEAGDAEETSGGSQQPPVGFNMNGFRYCEILITVEGDDGMPVTEVWGTPGVGPCDDESWDALDPEALMVEFGASSIHMNGPRYFTVDGSVDTAAAQSDAGSEQEIRVFGEVPMRLLATVGDGPADTTPYSPNLVVRTTTWTFNAGTEVYELTDPEGNTYMMQSYALIHDPDLTAEDLATLGDRLDLPEGWSYGSRVLGEDVEVALTPDGAIVVGDDLENSYQRAG